MNIDANGITIEYETFGPADAPAVLLIMGLATQLTRWPMPLVDALVDRAYRVIRYDNRDVGLSTKFDAAGLPDLGTIVAAMISGRLPDVPYRLADMAADAVALLDALGIARAHIMGASMGGMIAQLVAVDHPARVLSLTSIMSTTGDPALPRPTDAAMAVLSARPATHDREAIIAQSLRAERAIASPAYPASEEKRYRDAARDFDRMFYPQGFARHMAAIVADGDRTDRLRKIVAPTLVIHGVDDPLVPVAGGRAVAAAIPGARLVEIPGMGHDLPEAVIPQVVGAFEALVHASKTATG